MKIGTVRSKAAVPIWRTCVITAILLIAGTPTANAETISIDPISITVAPSTIFTLNVNLSGVVDVFAWQFDILFDPGIINVLSISEGPFLSGGETFFAPGLIDNAMGIISFTADTLLGPVGGSSGSGTIASVLFLPVGTGPSAIKLSNVLVISSAFAEIPALSQDGAVHVTPTPEPGTFFLLLAAGVPLVLYRARRRSRPRRSAATTGGCVARVVAVSALCVALLFIAPAARAASPPDINGDGVVNILDLAIVARCVGQPLASNPACRIADLDGNGLVDSADLGIVRAALGRTGFPVQPTADRIDSTGAGQKYVKGEILLILQPTTPNPDTRARAIAASTNGSVVGAIQQSLTYQLRYAITGEQALENVRSSIAGLPDVQASTFHYVLESPLSRIPEDPYYVFQWHFFPIRATLAWNLARGSRSLVTAIIDQGFDMFHPDLAPNILGVFGPWLTPTKNAKQTASHGTHVAGIACAAGNNQVGVTGTAWNCGLNLYEWHNILNTNLGSILSIQRAMIQAVDDGARVVNLSIATVFPNDLTPCTDDMRKSVREVNAIFAAPIEWANRTGRDVLWVFAAGNEKRDASCQSPASLSLQYRQNTITVAAIDEKGNLADFPNWGSNYGEAVNIAAPGVNVYSTVQRAEEFISKNLCPKITGYDCYSGTSMAAPVITGIATLVRDAHPGYTAAQIKACIVNTATTPTNRRGINIADAWAAVSCGNIPLPKITITKSGSGTGSISSEPDGLACGSGCGSVSASFANGTPLRIHAVAEPNSVFIGWGGDCNVSGTGDVSIVVAKDISCTAAFQTGDSGGGYTFTKIAFPGASSSAVYGINNIGDVVGAAGTYGLPNSSFGFIFSKGVFTRIDFPGGSGTECFGINDAGDIVGSYFRSDGYRSSFLLSQGKFSSIDPPGTLSAWARGINNAGQIVGAYTLNAVPYTNRGFLLSSGSYTYIDRPGLYTGAYGVNNAGQIVGTYSSGGLSLGFLRSPGGEFTDVSNPGVLTFANGINDAGLIVGGLGPYGTASGFLRTANGTFTPFYYPGTSDGTTVFGVNNAGQLSGTSGSFGSFGFIATPR